jgi:hypothetical protein
MGKRSLIAAFLSVFMLLSACGGSDSVAPATAGPDVSTVAGTATVSGNTDGTGAAARFYSPYGLAVVGRYLYVADRLNHAIRKVSLDTSAVTTLPLTDAASGDPFVLNRPVGITQHGGFLYVVERNVPDSIRKISLDNNQVTTLTLAGDPLPISTYRVINDNNYLYVSDTANDTIHKISIATGLEESFPLTVAGGDPATFVDPDGMATDGVNLFVADAGNHTVRKIVLATGEVSLVAGTEGVSGAADGTGAAAQFFYPRALALNGDILYVLDEDNFTIRKVVTSTGVVTTVAGSATVSGSTDGACADARFFYPRGLVLVDSALYVTDTDNHTIRKVVLR